MPADELSGTERALTEREREVLAHMVAGEDFFSSALREQAADARVLQGGSCCATIHIYSERWPEAPEHLEGPVYFEADWSGVPPRRVRLIVAGGGPLQLSILELVHEHEDVGPSEFPPPVELTSASRVFYDG